MGQSFINKGKLKVKESKCKTVCACLCVMEGET